MSTQIEKFPEKDRKALMPLMKEVQEAIEAPLPSKVKSAAVLEAVGADSISTRKLWDKVEARRYEMLQPGKDFAALVNGFLKPFLDALKEREESLDGLMTEYRAEQETARRKAEHEARLKAQAEQDRINAEREKEAKKVEKKDPIMAQQMRETVPQIVMPVIQKKQEKIENHKFMTIWKMRIVDPDAMKRMIRAALPEELKPVGMFLNYFVLDETLLNRMAKSSGANLTGQLPGIEFYSEEVPAKSTRG